MVNDEVPWNMDIHSICDILSLHKHGQVQKWLASHPKFHVHFTPTHASWLNQVELWFSILDKKVIYRDEFPDKEDHSGKIVGPDFFLSYHYNSNKLAITLFRIESHFFQG